VESDGPFCSNTYQTGILFTSSLTDGSYNPFPNFAFSGTLRPAYPLSAKRHVPDHIARPDYAEDGQSPAPPPQLTEHAHEFKSLYSGVPQSERKAVGQPPRILSTEEQDKMREVCKVSSFPYNPPPFFFLYHHILMHTARSPNLGPRCHPRKTRRVHR
jgi:hypothetical protein